MAFTWTCVPSMFLVRSGTSVPRFTTVILAKPHTGIRAFHLQKQQRQQCQHEQGVFSKKKKNFLTYTTFVSAASLGYALYNWRDDIRHRIESLNIPFFSMIHAASPPDDIHQNRDKYNFIADVIQECAPTVVYIEIYDKTNPLLISSGSGFIVSQDGLILTNAHVVIDKPNTAAKVSVQLYDGNTYIGTVEYVDMQSDLATVRINATNLPVMKLGSSANIRLGEFVVAIGSPLALNNTITSGIVSNIKRQSRQLGIQDSHMEYIQTDAAVTFGNSGGPLVNLNGEAIGINAMKMAAGISFAIPIDYAKEFLKEAELCKKDKDITFKKTSNRKYIGITMLTLIPETLHEMQQYTEFMNVQHGVIVWKVIRGSPAYNAGLQRGDIVTHANGEPVLNSDNIYKVVEQSGIVDLLVLRRGHVLHVKVIPEVV
ncbi:hypothetical protein P5V15_005603 [Pogonomyrmex californicus]